MTRNLSNIPKPPSNAAAERAVLGALLIDDDAFSRVSEVLCAHDFYATAHRIIYSACERIGTNGHVDHVLLRAELERAGELKKIGGEGYLTQLAALAPSGAGAEDFAHFVADYSRARQVREAARRMMEAANNPAQLGDLDDVLAAEWKALSERASNAERAESYVRPFSEIQEVPTDWLWAPFVPLGELTTLQADKGQGKTWLACELMAAVTTGADLPCPDGEHDAPPLKTGNALYFSREQRAGKVRARLEAVGADLSRVYGMDDSQPMTLLTDLARLERIFKDVRPRLAVWDPYQSFVPEKTDTYRPEDNRRITDGIVTLLRRYDAAGLLVRHETKEKKASPLHRGAGSFDISAACRSVLGIDNGVLRVITSNETGERPRLEFRITARGIEWQGVPEPPKVRACRFYRNALANGRPRPVAELDAEAEAAGFSANARKEGKRLAGVEVDGQKMASLGGADG